MTAERSSPSSEEGSAPGEPRTVDLARLTDEVIDSISARELEICDRKGKWYSLRISPYKTLDNKIDGAVLHCSTSTR